MRRPLLAAVALLSMVSVARGQEPSTRRTVVQATHARETFSKDIQRVAIGEPTVLASELLTSREILFLGKQPGRTSVIVWFADGSVEHFTWTVKRDLSLLQAALAEIHSGITIEVAPDRDAVVLRGSVPDIVVSRAAEATAQRYLAAGANGRGAVAQPLVRAETPTPPGAAPGNAPADEPVRAPAGEPTTSATVINLLRLERFPARPEERIARAIREVGGGRVTVRRIARGAVPDDENDVFLLEGSVENQVALMRVLTVAGRTIAAARLDPNNQGDITVVSNEAGALQALNGLQGANNNQGGAGGAGLGGGAGGQRGGALGNLLAQNVARAKILSSAGGRIVSFVDVKDLPQVRVGIRLYEVNRTKLSQLSVDTSALVSDFDLPGFTPIGGGPARAVPLARGPNVDAQNVLSFLGGALGNQSQLAGRRFAIDQVFQYLESEGIARSLSAPTLTVLSGETATFQAGGEVPVPEAFSPALGGGGPTTPGVFSSVAFRQFGVTLAVRPLVGDDDEITLDLQPQVVTPDAQLTAQIRQTTGAAVAATAFQARTLRTTARLDDGHSLLIGGLASRNTSADASFVPLIHKIPLLELLFQRTRSSDGDLELIIVVNPAIVRDASPRARLWAFPGAPELLRRALDARNERR